MPNFRAQSLRLRRLTGASHGHLQSLPRRGDQFSNLLDSSRGLSFLLIGSKLPTLSTYSSCSLHLNLLDFLDKFSMESGDDLADLGHCRYSLLLKSHSGYCLDRKSPGVRRSPPTNQSYLLRSQIPRRRDCQTHLLAPSSRCSIGHHPRLCIWSHFPLAHLLPSPRYALQSLTPSSDRQEKARTIAKKCCLLLSKSVATIAGDLLLHFARHGHFFEEDLLLLRDVLFGEAPPRSKRAVLRFLRFFTLELRGKKTPVRLLIESLASEDQEVIYEASESLLKVARQALSQVSDAEFANPKQPGACYSAPDCFNLSQTFPRAMSCYLPLLLGPSSFTLRLR